MWKTACSQESKVHSWLPLLIISLVAIIAYHNSFSGSLIFDDKNAIENNPTIRALWPIWPVITPREGGGTVCGRPMVNLSLAVNYAMAGTAVEGYHAMNLGIHVLAGWTLYGFLRRTLRQPPLVERFGAEAPLLALAVAVLWVLHPLQTASVTYIVQRAESLGGLFYLLTLYCFVRGVAPDGRRIWLWASVLACAVGMGCKEVVFSAPLLVLLYDRTFVAGSFGEAWRRRRGLYLAMASTWILLAYFIAATGNRGGTAGLAMGVTPLEYLQTQGCAILEYLRLSVWPHPLIFDYGTPIITDLRKILLPGAIVGALVLLALSGIQRRTWWAFFGAWFFAVLAPSSSIVPVVTQTMAVHRMYLPLAAVITILVLAAYVVIGKRVLLVCVMISGVFAYLTFSRNKDYRSEFLIWSDTVEKSPANPRALGNLGSLLVSAGRHADARVLLEASVQLNPNDASTRSNLGTARYATGDRMGAVAEFRHALALDPCGENRHLNLALALAGSGEISGAKAVLEAALQEDPENVSARRALEALESDRSGK